MIGRATRSNEREIPGAGTLVLVRGSLTLFVLALLIACGSSSRPPVRDDTPADAGTADATLYVPAPNETDGGEVACSSCATRACSDAQQACASDATCAGCYEHFTMGCFSNTAFTRVEQCDCTTCASDCKQTCKTLSCLRCVEAGCKGEFDACAADPTCAACYSQSPPPSCANDLRLQTLYACTFPRCATLCN